MIDLKYIVDPDQSWHEHATKRFAAPYVDKPYDRIDVDPVLLSEAGHLSGFSAKEWYLNPKRGIASVIAAHEAYDLIPIAHWWPTIHVWEQEMGNKLEWRENFAPNVKETAIKAPEDVDKLEVVGVEEIKKGPTFTAFTEAFDYVRDNYPNWFVPLYFGFHPEANASQLIGLERFLIMTIRNPGMCHKLIQKFLETSLNGCRALVERYGSALIVAGSTVAGSDIMGPKQVKEYGVKYNQELVRKSLKIGAGPQIWYHHCGNHSKDWELWRDTIFTPFTVMQVGYEGKKPFPLQKLKELYGKRATLMGNVDTTTAFSGSPTQVYEMAKEQILAGKDSPCGFISGMACECPHGSPPSSIHAMVRAARDFGKYDGGK